MTKVISILAIVTALATTIVVAQSRPNFAGKWTLVPGSNAVVLGGGGRMGAPIGPGSDITVIQDEKTLTVIQNLPKAGEVKSVFKLDGSKTSNPRSGRQLHLEVSRTSPSRQSLAVR